MSVFNQLYGKGLIGYKETKRSYFSDITDWKLESGLCYKVENSMSLYESGIFIAKIIDYITQGRSPCFDVND